MVQSVKNPTSLALTLDRVNDALLLGEKLDPTYVEDVSLWIAGRVGLKGTYAGMPAPTEDDFKSTRLFTGETLKSRASIAHILGEEACRTILLLGSHNPVVKSAIKQATDSMCDRMVQAEAKGNRYPGIYCCGTCTPAFWRHLTAGGLKNAEEEIAAGLMILNRRRLPEDGWQRFAFHWTVAALVEIGEPAKTELKFVAKRLDRLAAKDAGEDIYATRRKLIASKALEII